MQLSDKQIMYELSRLSSIGYIDTDRAKEYCRSLRYHITPEDLSKAIGNIIDTWVKEYFPRPADIKDAIARIKINRQGYTPDNSGDRQITAAFLGARWVIMELESKIDIARLNDALLAVNNKYSDNYQSKQICIDEMNAIRKEAEALPKKSIKTKKYPKAIAGKNMIDNRKEKELQPVNASPADNDLGF